MTPFLPIHIVQGPIKPVDPDLQSDLEFECNFKCRTDRLIDDHQSLLAATAADQKKKNRNGLNLNSTALEQHQHQPMGISLMTAVLVATLSFVCGGLFIAALWTIHVKTGM
jgi:hypothetical protein